MRRFLVGSCCVIVALQVLIGVPLAVCIAFFSVVDVNTSPVVVDMQSAAWSPEPQYGHSLPAPCVDVCPTPYRSAPVAGPQPAVPSLPPALPPMIDSASLTMASEIGPILEARAEQGSPLAGSTLLSGASSPAESTHEFIATFKEIADKEAVVPRQVEKLSDVEPQGVGNCPVQFGKGHAVVHSLRAAVEHLYALAQSLEADGSYGRADQIRDLARSIREEIHIIHRDHAPPADPPACATATAPPTVTEAPFNPEPPEPPAPHDAASSLLP